MNGESPPDPIPDPTAAAPFETPPAERYPFWTFADVAAFIGLAFASALASAFVMKAAIWALKVKPRSLALEYLPAQALLYVLVMLSLYFLLHIQYGRPFWESLGWTAARLRFGTTLLLGVTLAVFVAIVGSLLRTPDVDNLMKRLLSDTTSAVAVAIFATTIGPLCEELAFRGFLQPLLVRTLGTAAGILLTAAAFGLLHLPQYANSWRHALLVTAAGAAFGWVRWRTGSTRASTMVHAAYNGTFFLLLLVQRSAGD